MDSLISKFKNVFLEEAQNLLNSYESDLLQLEKNPNDTKLIESVFRSMHTLKGTSGMYGFEYIHDLTHKLESIFQAVRDKQLEFSKDLFDITFSSIDHIRKLLFDESLADSALRNEHMDIIEKLKIVFSAPSVKVLASQPNQDGSTRPQALWHILLKTTESQYFRGISIMNIFKDLANIGCYTIEKIENLDTESGIDIWSITLSTSSTEQEIREVFLFIEDDCNIVNVSYNIEQYDKEKEPELSILDAISTGNYQKKELGIINDSVTQKILSSGIKRISVGSDKLDHLMYLVSELITLNSRLNLSFKNNAFDSLKDNLEKLESLTKYFRNNALELHLVPLNDIVLRFQRLIRDLSKQLGKKIDFQTSGTDIEIDKSIIDKLFEPLLHIIRNSLDHGIESPEQRKSKGKPEAGIIKLSAYHSNGKIFIKIDDDGNGIDLEKVRAKAIHLGLIKNTENISKKDLMDVIFRPGFSTAESLTSVSGRGVGMDVVKKKIQELRGDVLVETSEGKGTTFSLVLQQSISIVDSLLFKVENSYFTVPLSDINICSDISFSELELRRHTSTIPYGDQLIPFIDIRKALCLGGQYAKKIKLIIFKYNERLMALLTDKIVGEHQAVIKPLGKFLKKQTYLTSASQLGDGSLAFMLDTGELMKTYDRT